MFICKSTLSEIDDQIVIRAYAISLRVTFLGSAILAVILCFLLLPVSVPDLPETESEDARNRDSGGTGESEEPV